MKLALTIAGSDSSGGAGIQADLKTFAAHGVFGLSAITAVTAQNTTGVSDVAIMPPALVIAQIDAVISDLGADAVKTGMLGNAAVTAAVADAVERHRAAPPRGRSGDGGDERRAVCSTTPRFASCARGCCRSRW